MPYLTLLRCLLFIGLILPVMVSGLWRSSLTRRRTRRMRYQHGGVKGPHSHGHIFSPFGRWHLYGQRYRLPWHRGYHPVQCGGNVTINNTGEITSPGFPLNYPNKANCEWKIYVDEGSRIKLTFMDFKVESCPYDYLEVFNGDTKDIKKRVAKLCGSDLPDPIESSGNTLILKFSSDYAFGYKGFKVQLTKTAPLCGPEDALADYAFLIDASGSMLPSEFDILKTFVKRVIDFLQIGPNQTHVGVIEYSKGASLQLNFSRSFDKREIKSFVEQVPHTAGITRIDLALKVASEQLFTLQEGMRDGSRKVMIILTDGNQAGFDLVPDQTPLEDAIQPFKDLGVKIIAIGIGSVDREQLATLATDPNDILQPKNFQELLTLVKTTVKKSCEGGNNPILLPGL